MTLSEAEKRSNLGKQEYLQKNYSAAIVYFTEAIEKASHNDPIHIYYSNRCACLLYLNNLKEALEDANACTVYHPNFAKGFQRLGNCLFRLRKYPEAISAFERALEIEPNNNDIKTSLSAVRNSISTGGGSSNFGGNANYGVGLPQMKSYLLNKLSGISLWWSQQSDQQKLMTAAGTFAGLYFIYSLFFTRRDDYLDDYHGYGYGSSGGGLSWTMWGAIMLAAYKLPPMFPEVLGYEYAKPFFGMSWTTFMWLLQMITNNRGGFGGRRRTRGFY